MRPSLLKNQILIFTVGCVLTLGFANTSHADGCWGSSRGGWGSGGGSFGCRGGLLSNQPVRNLLFAVGDRVGYGLSNLGNGIANVLEQQPLRNALSGGSCWGGSQGGLSSVGSRFVGRGGWGSGGGWGCGGSSYVSNGSLLTSPVSAPAYGSDPSYLSTPAFGSTFGSVPAAGIISADSLLGLPIVTNGGYGSAGSIASYAAGPSIGLGYGFGETISPVGLMNATLPSSSLNQMETSTHVLDYGYYGNQYGDIGSSTDSVMIDNALITGPLLETQKGSNSVIESSPSEFDFPSEFDGGSGGSEAAPDDAFGAEEDDSVYLPRGRAVLSLNVPRDAKVYINDKLTRTSGTLRSYVSRNLAFGEQYRYRVRVVSQVDGKAVTKNREITMRGGAREEFAFSFDPIVTRVALNVPEDAKVVIDGKETSATGAFRSFSTENLKNGKWEDYSVEVSVVRDGKTITKRESFDLGAGEFRFLEFEFGQSAASNVAAK